MSAFLFQEILAYRRKGIQQGAGFEANAAVHHVRLFIESVARRYHMLFLANGELKFPERT